MQYGVIKRNNFQLGNIDFYIDLVDMSYYGERAVCYYTPSHLVDNCWEIDFTKQFKTFENCKQYMIKQINKTCKLILKQSQCKPDLTNNQ